MPATNVIMVLYLVAIAYQSTFFNILILSLLAIFHKPHIKLYIDLDVPRIHDCSG